MQFVIVFICLGIHEKQKSGKNIKKGLKAVKDTFKDVDDYLSTFEPLLFEEVKAQIVARDEEGTFLLSLILFPSHFVLRLLVSYMRIICKYYNGFYHNQGLRHSSRR